MRRFVIFGLIICLLTTLFAPVACHAMAAPAHTGRVVDQAQLFSGSVKGRLTQKIDKYHRDTNNEMVVVTVNDLGGESVERYTMKLANRWQVGRNGNGIVLLIAKTERKVRLEVGYSLNATLTNKVADHIVHKVIIPELKAGNYGKGAEAAVDFIVKGDFQWTSPSFS